MHAPGCILRVTQHDGLPRMLIEGLLRGMYAIYAWPLAGMLAGQNPGGGQRGARALSDNDARPMAKGRTQCSSY